MPEHDYYLTSGFCGRKSLYWPMDDGGAQIADKRTQDYEGVATNSVQLGNAGFEFTDGYAMTEDPLILNMDFTVEFWVMPTDLRDSVYLFDSTSYYGPWVTTALYTKNSSVVYEYGLRRDTNTDC